MTSVTSASTQSNGDAPGHRNIRDQAVTRGGKVEMMRLIFVF
jgi:hypothetical protein